MAILASDIKGVLKLDLNVTNRCNLACPHCVFRAGECLLEDRPLRWYENLLQQFVEQGGQRIDITGGEPTMRRDCLEIVRIAKSLGIRVELVTNATKLTEAKLRQLAEIGLDEIAVSVDGADFLQHLRNRTGCTEKQYRRALSNIRLAASLGIKTKINTVVFGWNLNDIHRITETAIDSGCKEHGIYYFSHLGRGARIPNTVADPFEWLRVIREKLIKYGDEIKISAEVPLLETELVRKRGLKVGCFMEEPWHLQILPDGNVFPCAIMCAYVVNNCGAKPLGNLDHQSLREIWKGQDEMQRYHNEEVAPLFAKWGGCVDYSFLERVKSQEYRFVCLCKKFLPKELVLT